MHGVIYEMTGGRVNHSKIIMNVSGILYQQLYDTRCAALPSDMRVGLGVENYVYPDLSVVCGAAQLEDNDMTLLNPILTVEVTSPSSIDYDRETKLAFYRSLPSVQAYLIIDRASDPCRTAFAHG